jgi:hypothetical protein
MTERTYITSATKETITDHKMTLPYDHLVGGRSLLERSLCCTPRVVAVPITTSGPPSGNYPLTTSRRKGNLFVLRETS